MQSDDCRVKNANWEARSERPHRSVFGNYAPKTRSDQESPFPIADPANDPHVPPHPAGSAVSLHDGLQTCIDTAIARAFVYQFLARAFGDPGRDTWAWLTDGGTRTAFQSAVGALANGSTLGHGSALALAGRLEPDSFESFQSAYVVAFGHAARGDCPLNEIEYGDLNADPLFQPHRLADLAAFYRAFGLEVADGAAERPDHIGMELEFMSVLAAKEAHAHELQLDEENVELCVGAQKKFLREHLGRWSPAFARRLARRATDETLAVLAEFTRDFISAECARFALPAGSEDLLLRPVDEAAERLCDSCGLGALPPGAAATETRA